MKFLQTLNSTQMNKILPPCLASDSFQCQVLVLQDQKYTTVIGSQGREVDCKRTSGCPWHQLPTPFGQCRAGQLHLVCSCHACHYHLKRGWELVLRGGQMHRDQWAPGAIAPNMFKLPINILVRMGLISEFVWNHAKLIFF